MNPISALCDSQNTWNLDKLTHFLHRVAIVKWGRNKEFSKCTLITPYERGGFCVRYIDCGPL
jgi:hypothetical protein